MDEFLQLTKGKELSMLGHPEKDEIIIKLAKDNAELLKRIKNLEARL